MQTIRLARIGRKGRPFYRLVLTDSKASPQAGFKKVLGWFNPLSKEHSYNVQAVLGYIASGTQMSERAAKLLYGETKNPVFQKFYVEKNTKRQKKKKD
ncbi:MAG: 30S ribosomal protein S16 [Candidatus Absconditabacterales bacterium]|nr:30S ribosomal protein S16 [Candidatus Absconditabacterales bacterium]